MLLNISRVWKKFSIKHNKSIPINTAKQTDSKKFIFNVNQIWTRNKLWDETDIGFTKVYTSVLFLIINCFDQKESLFFLSICVFLLYFCGVLCKVIESAVILLEFITLEFNETFLESKFTVGTNCMLNVFIQYDIDNDSE